MAKKMGMNSSENKNNKQPLVSDKHNPNIATVLSVLFAGLGQLYNKRYLKGFTFIILKLAFIITCGDFINLGLWGLRTLGTIPGVDHSIFLLVYGIISVIILVFAIAFYVFNIIDARKQAKQLAKGWTPPSLRESFRSGYDKLFPYVLTTPGLILLIFSVVFPLLFAISLAFTNYDLYNSPPRHLVDWVGFENFKSLITVPLWKNTFFSVFSWTIVWTLVATTLQIALGLFLAVLVNDKPVKFKKLIRTMLILPWAVPGFVSILIFSAMFNDEFGAINRDIIIPLFGGSGIPWLTDPFYTKIALIFIKTLLAFLFM